ncbi:hypothetical protein [Endozoicomonas ascidiicola]|uniref:hypothetical protein n=1 Tax=Endozoicomonas ascidiicola TaxID=1698521 RepID=UPI00082F2267|nr:hypothetical protein [Endozoicomonas ascidiicola]
MKQQLYLLPGLKTARHLSEQLEGAGLHHKQLHIAHMDHTRTIQYHLNDLNFLEESDVIHSGERGFLVGMMLSLITGMIAWKLLADHPAGLLITGFACVIVLGFSTWLGGLIGVSSDNYRLQPFHDHISEGGAVLMVDLRTKNDREILDSITSHFEPVKPAGFVSSIDNPFLGDLIPRKHYS